jgi:hypothetical protein
MTKLTFSVREEIEFGATTFLPTTISPPAFFLLPWIFKKYGGMKQKTF